MLFNSYNFMIFFPSVVLVYFFIPKKLRYIWLLIVSYYFYMGWNAEYALLIAFSTVATFLSGILIDRCNEKFCHIQTDQETEVAKYNKYKKLIVVICFSVNVGILVFFKYFDFLLDNMNVLLSSVGEGVTLHKKFDVLLPVGISFYTFQALSYSMDVYRGEIKAEKNLFRYALFVSFFPQLVAGPIERSKNLLKQINSVEEINVWEYERIVQGLILMLWGLFQKIVIADRAAILVDQVYNSFWMYGSIELILATVLFAVQIYCDFGSYSLIAIGCAKVMGFTLMENFNTPYFATSIKDFWRRWHISLSTWFKDYLYIPLGGNRCSDKRNSLNIVITFLVSGLWHGASWSFIAWGSLHGIYQVIGKYLDPIKEKIELKFHIKTENFSYKLGQILLTFVLVDFAWIFFRMNSLKQSIQFIIRIVSRWDPWVLFDKSLYTIGLNQTEVHILILSLVILLLVDLVRCLKGVTIDIFLSEQNLWFKWTVALLLLFGIIIFGIYGPSLEARQFIYFQF